MITVQLYCTETVIRSKTIEESTDNSKSWSPISITFALLDFYVGVFVNVTCVFLTRDLIEIRHKKKFHPGVQKIFSVCIC